MFCPLLFTFNFISQTNVAVLAKYNWESVTTLGFTFTFFCLKFQCSVKIPGDHFFACGECIYNVSLSLSICISQIHITLCGQNQLGGGGGGHYMVTDQCRSSVQSGPFLGSVLSNEFKKDTNTPNVS